MAGNYNFEEFEASEMMSSLTIVDVATQTSPMKGKTLERLNQGAANTTEAVSKAGSSKEAEYTIHRDAAMFIPPTYETSAAKEKHTPNEPANADKKDEELKEEPKAKYHELTNTKALPKTDLTYSLEKFEKNAIIVFNQENVEGYLPRKGTEEDVAAISRTFSKFGFVDIEKNVHKDLSKVDLFKKLEEFSEQDFTDYGCVVIAILTHGTSNGLLRARDEGQLYSELDVINHFKSRNKPTLLTKPIVLLIQACRGTASTEGMPVMRKMKIAKDHDDIESYHLPVEADMLVVHSSFVGKPSFRPENGTWFIQTLCKSIDELYSTHDLESILVEVKRIIAAEKYYMEYNKATQVMEVNKQMPTVTSTLLRKLYLRSYMDALITPITPIELLKFETWLSSVPNTPAPYMPCSCFLSQFDYMKKCLSHFVEQNPSNTTARGLLDVARLETGTDEEKTKLTLSVISKCLHDHYRTSDYHKFIYYYHEYEGLDSIDCLEHVDKKPSFVERLKKSWITASQSNAMKGVATCVGAYLVYNLLRK